MERHVYRPRPRLLQLCALASTLLLLPVTATGELMDLPYTQLVRGLNLAHGRLCTKARGVPSIMNAAYATLRSAGAFYAVTSAGAEAGPLAQLLAKKPTYRSLVQNHAFWMPGFGWVLASKDYVHTGGKGGWWAVGGPKEFIVQGLRDEQVTAQARQPVGRPEGLEVQWLEKGVWKRFRAHDKTIEDIRTPPQDPGGRPEVLDLTAGRGGAGSLLRTIWPAGTPRSDHVSVFGLAERGPPKSDEDDDGWPEAEGQNPILAGGAQTLVMKLGSEVYSLTSFTNTTLPIVVTGEEWVQRAKKVASIQPGDADDRLKALLNTAWLPPELPAGEGFASSGGPNRMWPPGGPSWSELMRWINVAGGRTNEAFLDSD